MVTLAPSTAEIEEALARRKERRRRVGRRVMIGAAAFVLLSAVAILIAYLAWQARGKAQLAAEIADIRARGEPLTPDEVADYYASQTSGGPEAEALLKALEPFRYEARKRWSDVPLVGDAHNEPCPALKEPFAPDHQGRIHEYLQHAAPHHEALHKAATYTEPLYYPTVYTLRPDVDRASYHVRYAARSLRLEFQELARRPDVAACLRNLETRRMLAESLCKSPDGLALATRRAIYYDLCLDVLLLAEGAKLSDAQLLRLQSLTSGVEFRSQFAETLLGDRTTYYDAFLSFPETTSSPGQVQRYEDCALMLRMMRKHYNTARLPFPQLLDANAAVRRELYELVPYDDPFLQHRFHITQSLVICWAEPLNAARAEAQCSLTSAALGVHRYILRHRQAPQSLGALVPEFLAAVPLDPFDGKPLRYINEEAVILYSLNINRQDDGGVYDPDRPQDDDLAVEVWSPLLPARQAR
jgi:hypothetical protein